MSPDPRLLVMGKIAHTQFLLAARRHRVFGNPMRRIWVAAILWMAVIAWGATILWLSSLSREQLPGLAFLTWDKLNHFAAFAVGGWLTASALQMSRPSWPTRRSVGLAILLVSVFAAFDELFQLLSPGRVGADLYDWIADFLGAVAGALFSPLTHARLVRLVPRP